MAATAIVILICTHGWSGGLSPEDDDDDADSVRGMIHRFSISSVPRPVLF